jgi:hypothetical protein
VQNCVRVLFVLDTTPLLVLLPTALPYSLLLPAQQTRSLPASLLLVSLRPTTLSGGALALATSRSPLLEEALAKTLGKLSKGEKAAFLQALKTIDKRTLLLGVRTYNAAHKSESFFRPHAKRLLKFLDLLNRFIGGVAIGI